MFGCDLRTGGESGIRTRSQTANKGLNRARSANLVLVSACKTRELILRDLHSVFQMKRLEPAASAVTVLLSMKGRMGTSKPKLPDFKGLRAFQD